MEPPETPGRFKLTLVKAAIAKNAHHTQRIVDKAIASLGDVRGKKIALWGLTFKAGTDDLRNSPALEIGQRLSGLGASVQAYDPTVRPGTLYGIEVHSSPLSACRDAEALIVGTEWPEFASADLAILRTLMTGRVIVDGRNLLDPGTAAGEGFFYVGVGTRADSVHAREVAA
jgi:UDPglucose 6-dehydrogenase